MKCMILLLVVMCVLLSGCSFWINGNYSSVVPHTEPNTQINGASTGVANYFQMQTALVSAIKSGAESAVFTIRYDSPEQAEVDVVRAIDETCQKNPYAAYAVESIRYVIGTHSGQNAISVQISYRQNRVDLKTIPEVKEMDEVKELIAQYLDDCASSLVVYVDNWHQTDYTQIVADYALKNPHKVIEEPEVTVNLYPEKGSKQIVELKFTYQTSRDSLRSMQSQVEVVFDSAERFVERTDNAIDQYSQLYTFLMNRYSAYEIQTSITPAYSLLRHGVGDEKAFAMVYAAMCQQIGMDCSVITGTHDGVPRTWNVVRIDNEWYHIDLLRCSSEGQFDVRVGEEMPEYVWDYSLYPMKKEKTS